jgi:PAS domain S-box-containing protein
MYKVFTRIKNWHILLFAAISSEILTLFLTSLQSFLRWGFVPRNVIEVGIVDAFLVSLIVSALIIPIIKYASRSFIEKSRLENEISERKLADMKFRQLAKEKVTILNTITVGLVLLKDRKVQWSNPAFDRLFGYKEGETIGLDTAVFYPDPNEYMRVGSEGYRQIATGGIYYTESEMRKKDNSRFNCSIIGRAINSEDLSEGAIWTLQDITERKRAEATLRDSEMRYRELVDNSPLPIQVFAPDGRALRVNKAWESLWGASVGDLRQYNLFEDQQLADAGSLKVLTKAFDGAHVELPLIKYDKARIPGPKGFHGELWLRVFAYPVLGADGKPIEVVVVQEDVTERKRAEEELREKEGRYRLLFESANEGIFIHDETGVMDCNKKGAEMCRLKKEEIIGRSPAEFAPERQPDGRLSTHVVRERIHEALKGMPQVFEWQSMRSDGHLFDSEVTLNRIEIGGKTCFQAIVRDITDRKRLEMEINKAQKLESLGALAGGIAHDFNNLLQGVFGYISLAKLKRDDKEKSIKALEDAEKALHMSVNLTNQLLTFSKGGKPVKKIIELQPVIEKAVGFALSGSHTNYQMTVAKEGVWQIEADEGQISQVIQNIVLNADQAMPEGGKVEITLRNITVPGKSLPNSLEKGNYVEIAITDSGSGIQNKYLTKIFDPYFTTKEKGSGLGLATSYSIIKNHNGLMDVQSEPGKGTTFFIYIPAEGRLSETPDQEFEPKKTGARTGNILLMDDEQIVRDVAVDLIRALGHKVEFAVNGEEAIDKYIKAKNTGMPFDIVVLDLTIKGGIGGAETLKKLLEIDPTVKAIVSSGYSDDGVTATYLEQGFKAFLKKPYIVDQLRDILDSFLK